MGHETVPSGYFRCLLLRGPNAAACSFSSDSSPSLEICLSQVEGLETLTTDNQAFTCLWLSAVGPLSTQIIFQATWYGAPFDEDIRNIKPGIAKLRPPLDLESRYISFFFANAYCLDVKWSESDGIKSFVSGSGNEDRGRAD